MSSQLTSQEVARIAELARLKLTPQEADLFAPQLTAILEYAARVQKVDTSSLPPTAGDGTAGSSWRDDVVKPSLSRDAVLESAPDAAPAPGLFRVPKVI